MSKDSLKKETTTEEIELFRLAMKDIKPLSTDKVLLKSNKKRKLIKPLATEKEKKIDIYGLSDHQTEPTVSADDFLWFARAGISTTQIQKLKKGLLTISRRLDLHGLNTEKARDAVSDFVSSSYLNNERYILIVHGKGHGNAPVLKNKLNNWLRQIDKVLSFSTACPKDGGTGAVYVLIKNARKDVTNHHKVRR